LSLNAIPGRPIIGIVPHDELAAAVRRASRHSTREPYSFGP
jgi:hypothetical protein